MLGSGVAKKLREFLKQGLTSRDLARALSLGLVVGLMPILGLTTLVAAFFAWRLRLNMVATQFANYAAYPLQFLALIPFYKAGALLFQGQVSIPSNPGEIAAFVAREPWNAIRSLWTLTWQAFLVWALLAVPLYLLLARLLRPALERLAPSRTGLNDKEKS